jgi:dTMP kinase
MTASRGLFVVLEGCDGSGKSTQAERLTSSDRLGKCERMCFPDRTSEIGKLINDYLHNGKDLDDHVIHLLFSANRWETARRINGLLDGGFSIVCDRYWYSGVAYSAAKGLDTSWCTAPDLGLPAPDLVLYIDCDPEKLKLRGGFGTERYERLEFQKKVRAVFEQLYHPANWARIDGSQTANEVTEEIEAVLAKRFKLSA